MNSIPESRQIVTPADLASLIAELKRAVASGAIEQVPQNSPHYFTGVDIDVISSQGPWPDYIEMHFRVPSTGTRYKLVVETYHGAGGKWALE